MTRSFFRILKGTRGSPKPLKTCPTFISPGQQMEWIRLSAWYVPIKNSEKCHFWPIVFFSLNFFIITNMVYSSP